MNRDDKWKKLTEITDEYEINPDLAKRAIENHLAKRNASVRRKSVFGDKFVSRSGGAAVVSDRALGIVAAVVMSFALVAAVIVSVCVLSRDNTIYFGDDSLRIEEVENLPEFILENNLDVEYYSQRAVSRCAYIAETNEIGYLSQEAVVVTEEGFDNVELSVQIMKNAKFSAFEKFNNLDFSLNYKNLDIKYIIKNDEGKNVIFSAFNYNSYYYGLKISTESESKSENILSWHIKNLLGI